MVRVVTSRVLVGERLQSALIQTDARKGMGAMHAAKKDNVRVRLN